ncbi:19912_t:CDS:2, partial [Funneliformis geosporum]
VCANNMQDLIYKWGQVSVNKAYVAPVTSDDENMKDNLTHIIKKLSHSDQNGKSASKLKEFASNLSVCHGSSFSSSTHMSNTEKKSWLQEVRDLDGNPEGIILIYRKMQQPLQHENPQISNTNASTIHTIQNMLTSQIIITRDTNSTRPHFPIIVDLTTWVQPAGAEIGTATSEIIATPVTRTKVSMTNPQISGTVDIFAHSSTAILPASQSYNNSSNTSAVPVVTISALLTPNSRIEELLEALTIEQLSMIERTVQLIKRKK